LKKGDVKMGKVADGYKQFVDLANKNAEVKGILTGWDRIVQFIVAGDDNFYIESKGGVASFHLGVHKSPHVTMKGSAEVFGKMLSRELDATKAYFAKQYTIEGSMGDAMKFGRIGTALAKTQ
jgi:putative sterol carrier protein